MLSLFTVIGEGQTLEYAVEDAEAKTHAASMYAHEMSGEVINITSEVAVANERFYYVVKYLVRLTEPYADEVLGATQGL
jgi:hypothetical protein